MPGLAIVTQDEQAQATAAAFGERYMMHLDASIRIVYETDFKKLESHWCDFWQDTKVAERELLENVTEVTLYIALCDDALYHVCQAVGPWPCDIYI